MRISDWSSDVCSSDLSIGIDLPTMNNKDERQIAANLFDKHLPQPFERTAVNGFGFLQVIRRRERPSLLEVLREDPVLTAALALLRRGERHGTGGGVTLVGAPAVIARLGRSKEWIALSTEEQSSALRSPM